MNTQNQKIQQHTVKLDSKIYSLEIISAASNSMKGEAMFIFDKEGDNFLISITAKNHSNFSSIQAKFEQKLQELSAIRTQAEENKELKKEIIRQALMQQSAPRAQEVGFEDNSLDDLEASLLAFEQESLEDPLGISKPWHEQEK